MRVSDEELDNLGLIFKNLASEEAGQTALALKELQALRKVLPQVRERLTKVKHKMSSNPRLTESRPCSKTCAGCIAQDALALLDSAMGDGE